MLQALCIRSLMFRERLYYVLYRLCWWDQAISQAGIREYDSYSLLVEDKKINGYIYLRYYNVVDGKLVDRQCEEHNMTEYRDKFVGKSKIYNNGGSEVWR